MNRQILGKYLFATVLIMLIGWIAYDNYFSFSTVSYLDELAEGNRFVKPKEDFNEAVSQIIKLAHVEKPVRINSKYDPHYLNIYYVNTDSIKSELCAKGNALYDAKHDLIIIDQRLFNSQDLADMADLGITGTRADAMYAFGWFVFAHELGHRQLKHTLSDDFDKSYHTSKQEDEADNYSFAIMKSLMKNKRYIERYNLFEDFTHTSDKNSALYNSILEAGLIRMLYGTFTDIGISTGYHDERHPQIADRFRSLYKIARNDPVISSGYRQIVGYFENVMALLSQSFQIPKIEIQTPETFNEVIFNQGNLWFNMGRHLSYYKVSNNFHTTNNEEIAKTKIVNKLHNTDNYQVYLIRNKERINLIGPFAMDSSYSNFHVSIPYLKINYQIQTLLTEGRQLLQSSDVSVTILPFAKSYYLIYHSENADRCALQKISYMKGKGLPVKYDFLFPRNFKFKEKNLGISENNKGIPSLLETDFTDSSFVITRFNTNKPPEVICNRKYAMYHENMSREFMNGIIGDNENKVISTGKSLVIISDIVYRVDFSRDNFTVNQLYFPLTKLFDALADEKRVCIYPEKGGRRLIMFDF